MLPSAFPSRRITSYNVCYTKLLRSVGKDTKDTYNVAVRVPIPVEGVLQKVVGARARLGVTFYNVNEGGYVQVDVAGGSLSSTVNQINLTRANANSPMAETLVITSYSIHYTKLYELGPTNHHIFGAFDITSIKDNSTKVEAYWNKPGWHKDA